jgi:hypothetical protein
VIKFLPEKSKAYDTGEGGLKITQGCWKEDFSLAGEVESFAVSSMIDSEIAGKKPGADQTHRSEQSFYLGRNFVLSGVRETKPDG